MDTGTSALEVPSDPPLVANSGTPPPTSGVVAADVDAERLFDERVRTANQQFLARVGDALTLPVQVLIEQRDTALAELARQGALSQRELQKANADHERFVTFLMEEQLANLRHVRDQLDAAREELQRWRSLSGTETPAQRQPTALPAASETDETLAARLEALRAELEGAFTEIDETRAEAARLQEERDEAIRANDDLRVELQGEIDAARDETFEVQTKLDATLTALDDAHDEARDDAMRLTEELDELRRKLDERTEEVRRLRERLGQGSDEVIHSRPPPAGADTDLDTARREIKWLRQQLIEAKRQASKGGGVPTSRTKSAWKARALDTRSGVESAPSNDGVPSSPKVPDLG